MKIPPIVTRNAIIRKVHPESPPIVPGSKVLIRLSQAPSIKFNSSSPSGLIASKLMTAAATMTIKREVIPSNEIIARVPLLIKLSNLYRNVLSKFLFFIINLVSFELNKPFC